MGALGVARYRRTVAPGRYNSSLTRVQPFFEQAFALDGGWLSRLLGAAPNARSVLGDVLNDPGELLSTILRPHPSGKARRACFEYEVLPERPFLRWCIEHPEELSWPRREDFSANTRRLRRALLYDEPPGREDAQAQALELLEQRPVSERGWWRFEGSSFIDCVLATDRLVVTVEGKRTEQLSAATDWYPLRSQIVRNLEAARQIAKGRNWATLVISETELTEAGSAQVAASLDRGAPHCSEHDKAELQAAYMGNITWQSACRAVGLNPEELPDTVAAMEA